MASKETRKSLEAYRLYEAMGPDRTLTQLARDMKRPPGYAHVLQRWSAGNDWQRRVSRHDHDELKEALGQRFVLRERALQRLVMAANKASDTIIGLASGRMPKGQTTPVFDRHGERVGVRPLVAPSTCLQAAIRIHESIGIVPPKRIEIVDTTGEALDEAAALAGSMDDETLRAVTELLKRANESSTARQIH